MKLKKILTSLVMGAALSLSAMTASAGQINVGGVVFDPDHISDFLASGDMWEYLVQEPGDIAHGFGRITAVNEQANSPPDVPYCPNCQLTFEFGGYTLVDDDANNLLFTGGWLKIWVQDLSDPLFTAFSSTSNASAIDGVLWLSLAAHTDAKVVTVNNTPVGIQVGTLFGQIDSGALGTGTETGKGNGMFDVVGGLAAGNFNTNGVMDHMGLVNNGVNGFADFNFTSTFEPPLGPLNGRPPLTGVAVLVGNAIPEPSSILLLGIGILGFAMAARRRKS